MIRSIIYIILIFTLSCTMAPDIELKQPKSPEKFENEIIKIAKDSVIQNEWWKNLNDPKLVSYIDTMIVKNLDLGMMVERLKQLEAIADITAASQYPSVNATGSAADSKSFMVNNFIKPGPTYFKIENQSFSANLGLVFNLDIWGKVRSMKLAALNEVAGMKHDLQGFYQTMIVTTITMYVEIQSLKESIELTRRSVLTYQNDFDIQKRRYNNGIGSRFNLAIAQQVLSANEAKLIAEEQAYKKMSYQFSLLLGYYPKDMDVSNLTLKIDDIPTSVPSKILEDRHDIKKSYYSMEAARYRIGAARADFFPSVNLSASTGWNTSSSSDLFNSDLLGKNVAVNVSQNIFSGFATQGNVDQRWAEYRIAFKNYQKTILEAFKDVELAFINVKSSEAQYEAFSKNRKASDDALRFMQKRYTSGISDYQQLMDVKRNDFNSEANLIIAKKNKILSRVNLILKLGGKWN